MRNLKLSIAESIADLRAVQRTRYVSYGEQSGVRVLHDPRVRRDIGSGDTSETTQHVMVCDEGRCVATARLSLPDPDLLRAPGHRLGFEIEAHWDLRDLDPLRGKLVEVSRLAVLREYWASSAALRLYEGITRLSRDLGASHLIGAVDSGTDHPDDARVMRRVLAVQGGESWEFHVRPAASCSAGGVDRKPQTDFYTTAYQYVRQRNPAV